VNHLVHKGDGGVEYHRPFRIRPNVEVPELMTIVDARGMPIATTHDATMAETIRDALNGMILPGITCGNCGVFTGFMKERRAVCRACGAPSA
jgi:hypothetical protein